jgi:hypothetical protein
MLSSIELLAWIALVEEDYRSVGVSNEALLTTRFFPGARTRSKLDQNGHNHSFKMGMEGMFSTASRPHGTLASNTDNDLNSKTEQENHYYTVHNIQSINCMNTKGTQHLFLHDNPTK